MNQNLTILHAQLGQEIFDAQEKLNRIEFAHNQMVCELTVTRVQRDELLAALNMLKAWDFGAAVVTAEDEKRMDGVAAFARAAIAKAGGEA